MSYYTFFCQKVYPFSQIFYLYTKYLCLDNNSLFFRAYCLKNRPLPFFSFLCYALGKGVTAMEYTKTEESACPKNQKAAVHTLRYKKATCSRVPDTILHFSCSLDSRCKDCQEDYC